MPEAAAAVRPCYALSPATTAAARAQGGGSSWSVATCTPPPGGRRQGYPIGLAHLPHRAELETRLPAPLARPAPFPLPSWTRATEALRQRCDKVAKAQ